MPRCADMVLQAIEFLTSAVQAVDDEHPCGVEAAELARDFARAEKIAAAATVRLAGQTKDPSGVLAGALGTAAGTARRKLETAEAAAVLPVLQGAIETGDVSMDQAGVLAPVAAVSLKDAAQLVEDAANGASLAELKAKAARRLRAFRDEQDEVARERALHARRYCRVYEAPDGGVRIDAFLSGVDAARFTTALRRRTDDVFRSSWAAGEREPQDRLRADALVDLVAGESVTTQIMLRVDAESLLRGALDDGEICEIDGVGQVSLATARSLLPEASLTTLVRHGSDIRTVSSGTRVIPRKVRAALLQRDPMCVVPACGRTDHLENDHWRVDYSANGLTELDNLCRLCGPHHRMKTRQGFRLLGGPGKWEWLPPLKR